MGLNERKAYLIHINEKAQNIMDANRLSITLKFSDIYLNIDILFGLFKSGYKVSITGYNSHV